MTRTILRTTAVLGFLLASSPARADPVVDASYGLELGLRDFRYNDRVTNNLRSYSVAGAALGGIDVDLAPFAQSGTPVLAQLGLAGSYASAFDLSSDVNATHLSTNWYRFAIGPRYRARLGADPDVDFGAALEYGGETFAFDDATGAVALQLPDVSYRFVRPSIETRVGLGRVTLRANIAYMDVLSAGQVAGRIAGASVGGLDAGASASFAVFGGFEIRAVTSYRRFFYAFEPRSGDTFAAGGAVDQYASAQLAFAYVK